MHFENHEHNARKTEPVGDRAVKTVLLEDAIEAASKHPAELAGELVLNRLESYGAHLIVQPTSKNSYWHVGDLLVWSNPHKKHVMVNMPDGSLLVGEPDEIEEFVGALLAALSQLRKS